MQIEIKKPYKLMNPGDVVNVVDEYAVILIKKGVAEAKDETKKDKPKK
jgi:hypothetical protein